MAIACEADALEIAERLRLSILALDACRSLVNARQHSGEHRAEPAQHCRFHALYGQLASNKAQAQARTMAVIYDTEKTFALAPKAAPAHR